MADEHSHAVAVHRALTRRALAVTGVVAAGVLVAGGVYAATAHPSLPDRSANQVLASLRSARPAALSGTVVARSEFGLPAGLPAGTTPPTGTGSVTGTVPAADAPDALGGFTGLRRGTHSAKVWSDGPDRQRVLVIEPGGELDFIRNGTSVWTFDSAARRAVHATVPLRSELVARHSSVLPVLTSAPVLTPDQLSAWALAEADRQTDVSLDRPRRVADRSTYQLVLRPRVTGSLVDRVRIAVDADSGTPLAVSVLARGVRKPVLDVGFTSVHFTTPDEDNFRFAAPVNAQILTRGPTAVGYHALGHGWTAVLRRDGSTPGPGINLSGIDLSGVDLDSAAEVVAGRFGHGRLIRTALLSVLVTDDGRMYIGAVDPRLVLAAASG